MKLGLARLEEARANPRAMRAALRSTARVRMSFSRARALYLSAMRYHKEGDDLDSARDYLTEVYRKNFKRLEELPILLRELTSYASRYQSAGNAYITVGRRISIPVSADFELGGEIPRVDLVTTGGYAIWLFSRIQRSWRNELRMPLIQFHFAQTLGVDAQQIRVGFYFFSPATYESECFLQPAIDNARRECQGIGRVLTA